MTNTPVEVITLNQEEAKGKEYKGKVLTGKFPSLETEEGVIFESAAIARYIARKSGSTLNGTNDYERGLIDQFIDFSNTSIFPHTFTIYRATFGWVQVEAEAYNDAVKLLKESLKLLNTHF